MNIEKTLIIGLDGVEPKRIEDNDTPTLDSLGKLYKLESVVPYSSAPNWVSFQTGLKPEHHGVYGFINSEGNPSNSKKVRKKRIWERVDSRSLVMNLPLTYPPPNSSNSTFVSGLVTPVRTVPRPNEYYTLTNSRVIADTVLKPYEYVITAGEQTSEFEDYLQVMSKRIDCFLRIQRLVNWNLGIIMIGLYDRLTHNSKICTEELLDRSIEEMDKSLSKLLDNTDYQEVILLSDHGRKTIKKEFHLNQFLKEEGYLEFSKEGDVNKDKSDAYMYFEDHTEFAKIRLNKNVESEIISLLEEKEFVEKVFTQEELYPDPVGKPPDLMVKFDNVVPRKSKSDKLVKEKTTNQHSKYGFLIVDKKLKESPSIIDIAPSVIGRKDEMDGKVLG